MSEITFKSSNNGLCVICGRSDEATLLEFPYCSHCVKKASTKSEEGLQPDLKLKLLDTYPCK